jgi:hypothetical protein
MIITIKKESNEKNVRRSLKNGMENWRLSKNILSWV